MRLSNLRGVSLVLPYKLFTASMLYKQYYSYSALLFVCWLLEPPAYWLAWVVEMRPFYCSNLAGKLRFYSVPSSSTPFSSVCMGVSLPLPCLSSPAPSGPIASRHGLSGCSSWEVSPTQSLSRATVHIELILLSILRAVKSSFHGS